ncbi:Fibronectin-binding protein (FBP) [Thermoanaerobacter siderophilus SR4]|uniref:Fibronectin-binding protein (FBP) n=1 Tax=Thermoanaerobacter siderophilus SR4 TaxID=880478 RepID=I9KVF7_9THEO|nr:SIR2 family protein [Thermoanaerobacter siderophilus]EIW00999.1 Fibronectin-binding protein (FBP) [Thermoanaerobacter siderophilus SR4]
MEEEINYQKENILFISNEQIDIDSDEYKNKEEYDKLKIRSKIEPWLTAIFQSEHLSLLVGQGLSIALSDAGNLMSKMEFNNEVYKSKINNMADEEAKNMRGCSANFEDTFRVAMELLKGYEILGDLDNMRNLEDEINEQLKKFLTGIIEGEKKFLKKVQDEASKKDGENLLMLLKNFLISFASRTATRDRLNIFTTNYDRFIEYGLDEAGILILDRFIGKLKPIMRFHRIDLDYHYNPPGIRGEPRYVEGVVRFAKLHGSIDWEFDGDRIVKTPISFGEMPNEDFFKNPFEKVVIYPNSSKAVETAFFPYSELFRDFSTAICRPNSVLVTYGYGFGDSHINRIILDMLTIPSTHLVIISRDLAYGRIKRFIKQCNLSQLTLLIGKDLADFSILTKFYLPKPAIDRITERQVAILEKRGKLSKENDNNIFPIKEGVNSEL